jgi:hypothetical protein
MLDVLRCSSPRSNIYKEIKRSKTENENTKAMSLVVGTIMEPEKAHIVIVPFKELLRASVEESKKQGIATMQWVVGTTTFCTLIFVSAELAVREEFLEYVQWMENGGDLAWMMLDEAQIGTCMASAPGTGGCHG